MLFEHHCKMMSLKMLLKSWGCDPKTFILPWMCTSGWRKKHTFLLKQWLGLYSSPNFKVHGSLDQADMYLKSNNLLKIRFQYYLEKRLPMLPCKWHLILVQFAQNLSAKLYIEGGTSLPGWAVPSELKWNTQTGMNTDKRTCTLDFSQA